MNDIVAAFIEYLTQTKHYSVNTATAYELDIRDFIAFFERFSGGPALINDVARADTKCFRAWLADRAMRQLSHKSTARALSSLRAFFRYLFKFHNIKNDAIGLISSPKIPHKLSKAIDPVDVEHMRGALHDIDGSAPWLAARDWALVLLLFGCGLRISEALSLRICDVASRPDVLRIIGKGRKERIVPVLPPVYDAIERYIAVLPFASDANAALFRSVRGLPMSPRMAQKVVEKLRYYLQLPDYVTPHALRHTFATAMLAGGADLRSLQELLGHASLSSTQLYTKVNLADIMNVYSAAHPRAREDFDE